MVGSEKLPRFAWLRLLKLGARSGKHHAPPGRGTLSRLADTLLPARDFLFSMDIYGYTPSLIVSEYKTLVSLITSLLVMAAFLTAVAYTTYIWVVAELNQTEAEGLHDETISMLPDSVVTGTGDHSTMQLSLPQFGVLMLLGNGTVVRWPDFAQSFKLTFEQVTICNSNAGNKKEDAMPQEPCEFSTTRGIANVNVTRCVAWNAAKSTLEARNNTASNPCNVSVGSDGYVTPRVVGTFYNTEYSYITATVSVNSSLIGNTAFLNTVSKGSMQVFLSYNFTSPGNLASGVVKPDLNQVWSRRMNLYPNMTIKAEILLRARVASVHSYWWDVPSLQDHILDYTPWNVESYISVPGSVAPGWTDVCKLYLRFDDKDTLMDLVPVNDALAIISGWGGFLSVLLALGMPAIAINQLIFQKKVKQLIVDDRITFDEDVRTVRSAAVAQSYVAVGGKNVMSKPQPQLRTKSRIGSMLGFQLGGASKGNASMQSPDNAEPSFLGKLVGKAKSRINLGSSDSITASNTGINVATDGNVGTGGNAVAPRLGSHNSKELPNPQMGQPQLLQSGSKNAGSPRGLRVFTPANNAVAPEAPVHAQQGGMHVPPVPLLAATGNMAEQDVAVAATQGTMPTAALQLPQQGSGPASPAPVASPGPVGEALEVGDSGGTGKPAIATVVPPQPEQPAKQPLVLPASFGHELAEQGCLPKGPDQETSMQSTARAVVHQSSASNPRNGSCQACASGACADGAHKPLLRARHGSVTIVEDISRRSIDADPDWAAARLRRSSVGSMASTTFGAPVEQQVASMAVKYDGDCFADDDEDENYEDVVRHATSECNALFHLRQVVKLVQEHSPVLTLWSDTLTRHQQKVVKKNRADRERELEEEEGVTDSTGRKGSEVKLQGVVSLQALRASLPRGRLPSDELKDVVAVAPPAAPPPPPLPPKVLAPIAVAYSPPLLPPLPLQSQLSSPLQRPSLPAIRSQTSSEMAAAATDRNGALVHAPVSPGTAGGSRKGKLPGPAGQLAAPEMLPPPPQQQQQQQRVSSPASLDADEAGSPGRSPALQAAPPLGTAPDTGAEPLDKPLSGQGLRTDKGSAGGSVPAPTPAA